MSFLNDLILKFSGKYFGEDRHGNKYYLSKILDSLGKNRRYVIYKKGYGSADIPPIWHAWLHYTIDENPAEFTQQQIKD